MKVYHLGQHCDGLACTYVSLEVADKKETRTQHKHIS